MIPPFYVALILAFLQQHRADPSYASKVLRLMARRELEARGDPWEEETPVAENGV